MARKPRIEFSGALYHVYSRGNQKQKIFLDEQDTKIFLKRLLEYKGEYGFILYAYTLMPNHFHLLLETREVGLSKIMQGLLLSYTQYFNLKYKKVGHLFQGRYKAQLCQKESYLLELIRYLHLNSVRAGIVDMPDKYKWSSHNDYMIAYSEIVDVDLGLGFFAGDKNFSVKKYTTFIRDGMKMSGQGGFYAASDQHFLGDKYFLSEICGETKEKISQEKLKLCDFSDVWTTIEKTLKVKKAEAISHCRNTRCLEARAVFVNLCRKFCGKKSLEIADELHRDPAMVTNLNKLCERSFQKELAKVVEGLNSKLKPDPKCPK